MLDKVSDFLAHHGVKGMKWGVRQDRKLIKENYATNGQIIRGNQQVRLMMGTMDETDYAKLSDKDFVVGRNAVLKRTTRDLDGDEKRTNNYVSINEADATIYRGFFPSQEKGLRKKYDGEYYESTYNATTQLKSPSEKKRVDAYIKLMDKKAIETVDGETINGREYLRRMGLGDTVDALSSKELALTYYGQMMQSQGSHNEPLSSAYFKTLRDQGYNAVVDDNDRGVYSNMPILVLDSAKNMSRVDVKQLTTEDIHTAQATLKAPRQRN